MATRKRYENNFIAWLNNASVDMASWLLWKKRLARWLWAWDNVSDEDAESIVNTLRMWWEWDKNTYDTNSAAYKAWKYWWYAWWIYATWWAAKWWLQLLRYVPKVVTTVWWRKILWTTLLWWALMGWANYLNNKNNSWAQSWPWYNNNNIMTWDIVQNRELDNLNNNNINTWWVNTWSTNWWWQRRTGWAWTQTAWQATEAATQQLTDQQKRDLWILTDAQVNNMNSQFSTWQNAMDQFNNQVHQFVTNSWSMSAQDIENMKKLWKQLWYDLDATWSTYWQNVGNNHHDQYYSVQWNPQFDITL